MSDKSAAKPGVVIYTTSWCPYCKSAKALLTKRGVSFEEIDGEATWGDAFRDEIFKLTGQLSVPQVVVDGKPIGGMAELLKLDEQGELKGLGED